MRTTTVSHFEHFSLTAVSAFFALFRRKKTEIFANLGVILIFKCVKINFKQFDKSKFEIEFTQIICLTQTKYLPAGAYPPCRRSPARLPHASVGLAFWTTFSANIADFSGFFHPFCVNKKLKTHLREHSRQSPVPKIRSCFLSEFSACRSVLPRFFFLLSGASFFFLSQKKEERCGKNMF